MDGYPAGLEDARSLQPKDVVGMSFDTIEMAYNFYNAYAAAVGFSTRAQKVSRRRNGEVRMKEWCCSKEGKRRFVQPELAPNKRRCRDETRCRCLVRMRIVFDLTIAKWVVSMFVPEHNHPLTQPDFVRFLASHRTVTEGDMAQMMAMRASNIRPTHIMQYMSRQAEGVENVGFTRRDMYNAMQEHTRTQISTGDAQRALAFLDLKKTNDDGCFHEHTCDEDGRLKNLFWCDTSCRFDYACFGDVLAFDATYKTNLFNRPLVILIGVNNHHRTCFFGCSILIDETTTTYMWLLDTFLRAMGNKMPVSVITDGCKAMAAAIRAKLPNARHRLCEWHLERNCSANIHRGNFPNEVKSLFRHKDPETFDTAWHELLERHEIVGNPWAQEYLYDQRRMWCDAYLLGHFFAGQRTT
ncbi:protein FAR1-RELATED SEQUENCE 5-like [Tripterygium wilfordii]|uniref:protein FAR1-RELATED SEQUENCE 5-like n=1 Tax=Tripterygium wilfordii TaxID=458696 RepID=UPI0018F80BCC|nr:protein FAR1-RELATED SEQUENCE 5-like [Tripterygium wilfordii]